MAQGSDKDPNTLALGRAVKLMREQTGMSVEELADTSGVTRECIGALEAGQLDPSYELLLEIADGLGAKPSALVILAERLRASTDYRQP